MNKATLGFIFLLVFSGCGIVGPRERGIRVVAGSPSSVLESGPHLWIPVLYGIAKINVSIQKTDEETSASSKDMQEVRAKVAVNWSVDPEKVNDVYKTIGDEDDVLQRVVMPAVSEIFKAAFSKKTAEEILIQRLELKKEIDVTLKERLKNYNVLLTDLSIVNLTFSEEFTKAIEHKQIAEQQAKQSKYLADKALEDAKAFVNTAQGQAEAQKLLKSSITQELLQKMAIEKWNGVMPTFFGGKTLPFVNLKNESQGE